VKGNNSKMELLEIFTGALTLAMGAIIFFIRRILETIDDGQRRILKIEIELARMKQSESDLHDRLDRIEEKLDQLLSKK
tara:strand:+ start:18140 stop:18376 length:237 start_codon:yes stop_codon:yes gene_type:complete